MTVEAEGVGSATVILRNEMSRDISDRIYTWGYVLDRKPTACPFVFMAPLVGMLFEPPLYVLFRRFAGVRG